MERFTDEAALLVAQTGPLNGQRWPINKNILIGREPDCDIVIADRQVSRHHARLRLAVDGVFLEDLQSKNGTHRNGQPFDGAVMLQDGDTIQIAVTQKFVFLSSDATLPLDEMEAQQAVALPLPGGSAEAHPEPGVRRLRLEKRSRRVWIIPESGETRNREVEVIPPLSVSQFRLLEALYENQGRVISRPELAATVWGEDQAFDVSEQALDALVRRLRERIASIHPEHEYIVTVRGHGLRLENPTT
ncbi:MAG: FHA domain-containing protein [Chloroflexota bacterium]